MFKAIKKIFFTLVLPFSAVSGANSTWEPPGPGVLSNPSSPPFGNWSHGIPNVSPSDVGTFTLNGAPSAPSLNVPLIISNITFTPTTEPYNFNLNFPAALNITGAVDNQSTTTQTFTLRDSSLTFSGNSPNGSFLEVDLNTVTTGSKLNITGPFGTTVSLFSVTSSPQSSVTVETNTLSTLLNGDGTVSLVFPEASLVVTGNSSYAGVISGPGSVTFEGSPYFLLGPNTYTGGTTVQDGANLFLEGNGNLSPTGSVTLIAGTVGNSIQLKGTPAPLTYTFGDLLGGGVNSSLQINANTLLLDTLTPSTFGGALSGANLVKQGVATQTFTGNSTVSTVQINQGALNLSGSFTGSAFTVQNQGTLTGLGTIQGAVNVIDGGTMAPGSPLGAFSINGSYSEGPATSYLVQVQGVANSETSVNGTASLTGGEVFADLLSYVNFYQPYPILTASGGVTGVFNGATASTPLVEPILVYTQNSVNLEFIPTFENGAFTYNERQVAKQFDTLIFPDVDQRLVIEGLFSLDPAGVGEAYDQLSGNQYSVDPFVDAILTRGFIRRLYDPLRPIVTHLPCERCEDPCAIDTWIEGGYERAFLRNDGNGFGFNLTGWEITAGFQKYFSLWTIGLAGSYGHDFIRYNLGGYGKVDSGFLGLYGLYRPNYFYVLGDLVYGFNKNHITRSVSIGAFNETGVGQPETQEIAFYIESGLDLPFWAFLFQPFVALETDSYRRGYVSENGLSDFNLILDKRENVNVMSRLGFHFSTTEIDRGFSLSFDASWDYQFNRTRNDFRAHFATFGDEFTIKGAKIPHSSFEGEVALIKTMTDTLFTYVEFSGQVWNRASSFSLVAGIQNSW